MAEPITRPGALGHPTGRPGPPDATGRRAAERVLFGAAYYPEYLDDDRVAADLRLMAQAGFTAIRVGESVWSTWEPRDGQFELDWLAPVLDAAEAHGIGVILGTPTYAVPPWLMVAHPEIAAEDATGRAVPWGSRQETDLGHPVFRRYAERVVRAIVRRYADHPAVIGYQVDNEPGQRLAHNEYVFTAFKRWLLDRHGSVAALNRRWNLTHWSHRLSDIDELWRPDGNLVPQYDLAWRRFQAERTTEFITWQQGIVRELAREDQFVTTCIDPMVAAMHDGELAPRVEVVATNQYLATQSLLDGQTVGEHAFPPSGSWAPFWAGDRGYGMRQDRFLLTESNASSIGHPWFNFPAYDGQWRQIGWAMIARGARAIGYWHWHTMHASWESSWGGVLSHSLEPGRTYAEIARLGREIAGAGTTIEGLVPDADVGLVFSMPTRWAFEFHPPIQDPSAAPHLQAGPDRAAYERIVYRFYGGLNRAGLQVRLWHAEQLVEQDPPALAARLPVLVVPALALVDDRSRRWFLDYAEAGGHLVLGVRTATADGDGRIRAEVQPAGLASAARVRYDEFSNLLAPVPVVGELCGTAELLVEGLVSTGARVLAGYDHPHFGRWSAVTTTDHGAGRITTVGTVPDLRLATRLGHWLADASGRRHPWADVLDGGTVQVHGARNGAGERLWFVHNFSGDGRDVVVPVEVVDVLADGTTLAPGGALTLGPWDVRVLREPA